MNAQSLNGVVLYRQEPDEMVSLGSAISIARNGVLDILPVSNPPLMRILELLSNM
jgi:hypothetical protein